MSDAAPALLPSGHDAVVILRSVPGERVVLRARAADGDRAVLVLLTPVPTHFSASIRGIVLRGRGSIEGLPVAVSRTLEGFRVRARLSTVEGLAEVVDAGVLQPPPDAGVRAPTGHGFVYVCTRWVDGEPLDRAWAELDHVRQRDTVLAIADRIVDLHAHHVFFGDLKPGNVVVHDAGVTFIDLETVREVSTVAAPVRCLEFTPGYAAPEQEVQHEGYLASDVWALGVLAATLLGGCTAQEAVAGTHGVDGPWARVLDACMRPMHETRPTAEEVARALRGEDVDLGADATDPHTIRLADPSAPAAGALLAAPIAALMPAGDETTARVPEPEAPVVVVPDSRPRRRGVRRLLGGLMLLAVLVGVGTTAAVVAGGLWVASSLRQQSDARALADAKAAEVVEGLRRHKTDASYNHQAEVERILVEAEAAVAIADTDAALGAHALALAWAQRWHYAKASWDPAKWATADEVTRRADARPGRAPTARLARGMVLSAACRLAPSGAVDHDATCARAESRLSDATRLLPVFGDRAWLGIEARWAAEMLDTALVLEAWRSGDRGAAERAAKAGLRHCDDAWPGLDAAPVNGIELIEDCVAVAGWAGDYEAYLRWADRLLTERARNRVAEAKPELVRIYRGAALECMNRTVPESGWPSRSTGPRGGWEDLCDYAALTALGCLDHAQQGRPCAQQVLGLCIDYDKQPGVPWNAALRAAKQAPRTNCALSGWR